MSINDGVYNPRAERNLLQRLNKVARNYGGVNNLQTTLQETSAHQLCPPVFIFITSAALL